MHNTALNVVALIRGIVLPHAEYLLVVKCN